MSRLRVIVTGLIGQHAQLGGVSWDYLQYPLGLARLGHDVFYVEDSGEWPYSIESTLAGGERAQPGAGPTVEALRRVLDRFGLGDRWAYRFARTGEWFGMADDLRSEVIRSADLLLNVSGTLECPERYDQGPRLVYIDSDPVFTQIHVDSGVGGIAERAAAHHVHFTFGETLATADVPETPYTWRPTRQPVVLDEWETDVPPGASFTTVMNLTSYRPLTWDGREYGQKDVSLAPFVDLPAQVNVPLALAIPPVQHSAWTPEGPTASEPTDPRALSAKGWTILDSTRCCGSIDDYRSFVLASAGEWSVAKAGYVVGAAGWFSCRSACYLAAGRPVVVQDTGFGTVIPSGDGVLTFRTLPEAADALEQVRAAPEHHARAARELAHEYFDARTVLPRLLQEAGDGA